MYPADLRGRRSRAGSFMFDSLIPARLERPGAPVEYNHMSHYVNVSSLLYYMVYIQYIALCYVPIRSKVLVVLP